MAGLFNLQVLEFHAVRTCIFLARVLNLLIMVQRSHFSQARGPDGNLAVAAELEDMQGPKERCMKRLYEADRQSHGLPLPPRLNSNFQKAWICQAQPLLQWKLSCQPGRANAQPVCSWECQTLSRP